MDDLKTLLFQKTYEAVLALSEANAQHEGCHDPKQRPVLLRAVNARRLRFLALYDVIEAAELVDEYETWRKSQP